MGKSNLAGGGVSPSPASCCHRPPTQNTTRWTASKTQPPQLPCACASLLRFSAHNNESSHLPVTVVSLPSFGLYTSLSRQHTDSSDQKENIMPGKGEESKTGDEVTKGIELMYKTYEKLNGAADKTTLEGEFRELLLAVKRSDKEKRLASQFITRFFEAFPLLYNEAINALLDLCEDEDLSIRKQVCKDLVTVCKKVPSFVAKIADVFSQVMQTEDNNEHKAIEGCLGSLFHIDAQAALVGVFYQLQIGEYIVKERCYKFLRTKFKEFGPEIMNNDFQKCLMAEWRRLVNTPGMTGNEFENLTTLLMETKLLTTVSGQQMLVDVIAEILDFDKHFDASEAENFDKLLSLSKYALQNMTSQVSSTNYLIYYCTKVLPNLGDAVMLEDGRRFKYEAMKMLADMAAIVKQISPAQAEECLKLIFKHLVEMMPLPPDEEELNPKLEFGLIETLLFSLHKLGGFNPAFLTSDAERLKDFRLRLQYLARATQAYMKKLREDLTGKRGEELRTEENRTKVLISKSVSADDNIDNIQALKLTANIIATVKDLFHSTPLYKSTIGLSWRPLVRTTQMKRQLSNNSQTPSQSAKQPRGENRALYQPPSGKFSARAGAYSSPPPRLARGGMRGGGNFRGRGRGRRGRGF